MRRATARVVAAAMVCALVSTGCSLIGGGGKTYTLIAYFPRAVSVYVSSQVRVLGLPAGRVERVDVVADQECAKAGATSIACVKVTMAIDSAVPVPKDVHALIAPQSLIGERYIQLSPAWRTGQDKAPDKMEITDTIIPVEPDEALAALKKFLDSLDPEGLGRLINNAADDLQGQGATLNHALDQVSQLVTTFADKDQQLADIVDNFDKFTATLSTRESQLGDILSTFASATQVLADERQNLENLLAGLASLSTNGLQLVAKHSQRLQTDIDTLTRLAQSIDVNLDGLGQLLDSGPQLVKGIMGAYNPTLRAFNLRNNFGPLAQEALAPVIQALITKGLLPPGTTVPTICPPVLQECGGLQGLQVGNATTIVLPPATTPIDDLLGLLGAPTVRPAPAPSNADRIADGAGAFGGFFRHAAGAVVGAT
jgi:virulence factor Mce-like protein